MEKSSLRGDHHDVQSKETSREPRLRAGARHTAAGAASHVGCGSGRRSGPSSRTTATRDDASAPRAARIYRTCHGKRATIVAGNRGTTIVGTRRRDIIQANGGRDRIKGRGGRDLICSGRGRDIVDGGRGNDRVYGGRGIDLCMGQPYEHRRLHFGCERHLPDLGSTPPTPGRMAAPKALTSVAPQVAGRQARRDATYDVDVPACGPGAIVLGNAYMGGYGTNPGLVAFRPTYWEYSVAAADWLQASNYDYDQYYIPNDGQNYAITAGSTTATPNSLFVVSYEMWWSPDGATYPAGSPNAFFVSPYYYDSLTNYYDQVCWT